MGSRLPFLLSTLVLISLAFQSQAQIVDTIVGSDDFPQTFAEIDECTMCSYDLWYGTTNAYTPSDSGDNCSSSENDQYIGFVTNASGSATFQITSFNCSTGDGIQVGVYDEFNQQVLDCFAPEQQGGYRFNNLTPDKVYFLRIAEKESGSCEFNIQAISGIVARTSCAAGVSNNTSIQTLGFAVFQSSTATLEVISPSDGWKLSIVDVLGREVLSTALLQDNNQLSIDHLVASTYFVSVRKAAQAASMKWVKR